MSAKIVNKKKYYTALATIGVVGGISVLAFVVLKKPKLKLSDIEPIKEGDKVVSKKYNIKLGLRNIEIISKENEVDELVVNVPLYIYTFKTIEEKDSDGLPKVQVTIKSRINSTEEKQILDAIQD